jgi:hypothetical protein
MSVSSFGCIMGPLWGGVGLGIGNLELFGVLLGCWGLLSVLLLFAFKSLKPKERNSEETKRLLINDDSMDSIDEPQIQIMRPSD